MSLAAKMRRAPLRAVTGAFILNSGVSKLSADEGTAKQLHGMATGTYPFLDKVQPTLFAKGLAVGEIALGATLLLPVVPAAVAGLGLVGFSGALLNMYWNTPGMHADGDPRPSQQGIAIAKDSWLFGIGTALVADSILEPAHDKRVEVVSTVAEKRSGRSNRKAKKAAKKARAEAKDQLADAAREAPSEASKKAHKVATKTVKRAQKASDKATKRLHEARAEYGSVAADKAKHARKAARDIADEYGSTAADKAKHVRDAAQHASERAQHAAR